ncbi:MAG: Gfo/Idh/MocA family oxidoreductase [Planctomycetaceae bacterium]|nr:Gfo/Idh/MocA family oxidoreductase [Planctomycetaceae bacterium]
MSRFVALWTMGLTLAMACAAGQADEKKPVRLGILGIDNYQAVEYVQMYNNPKAEGDLAGLRVTAAWPVISEDYPKSAELTEMWKKQMLSVNANPKDPATAIPVVEIVDSLDELLKRCDAVMIWSLDGRKHLAQATAVMKAGKPVFIGRPLASSVEDAIAIFKVSEELKVPCWSCSQHRFSPGFIGMRNHPEVGKVLGCDVYGGYDVNAPEADKFTRSIHSIETLYTIMGPGVVKVSCQSTPTAESVTAVWGDGRVATYRGVKQGAVKYSATVFGDKGVSTAGIYGHGVPVKGIVPTNDKYMGYGGLAIEMAKFFKGEPMPVKPAETLEMYALMKAADESRAKGGVMVELPKLTTASK